MTRLIAFLFFTFGVTTAVADPVVVRSGEHAGFSRLVFPFEPMPDWQVGRVEGGYELRVSGAGTDGFETRRIFDLIPRQRLKDVAARGPDAFFMAVECSCHVNAFEVNGKLVIDIATGPADASSPFEKTFDDVEPANSAPANEEVTITPEPPVTPSTNTTEVIDGLKNRDLAERTSLSWAEPVPVTPRPAQAEPERTPSDPVSLNEYRNSLATELARAATHDLIEPLVEAPNSSIPDKPRVDEMSGIDTPASPTSELATIESGHVRIETAVDRGFAAPGDVGPVTSDGMSCFGDELLNLADWGAPPTDGEIGYFRSNLLKEFDEADTDAIVALAKNYVYLTFGAEAQALIDAYALDNLQVQVVNALAQIMDDGQVTTTNPFADKHACANASALWAALANPKIAKTDRLATDAIFAAFGALPLHLRRHLGPVLARRLVAIGEMELATAISASVLRAPGDHGQRVELMRAEMDVAHGRLDAGVRTFRDLIESDSPLAAEALVRLAETEIALGRGPEPALVETAESLAFEARGTALGAELRRARIRVMARDGQLAAALNEVESHSEGLGKVSVLDLRREIFEIALNDATDEDFMAIVFAGPVALGSSDRDRELRLLLATRLAALGLNTKARAILGEYPGVASNEERLLFARTFLDDGKPDMAIGYLAGLTGDEATVLRAQAHALAGQHDEAHALFSDLGTPEEAASEAWRAGNWAAAAGSDLPFSDAAALAIDPTPSLATADLAGSRAVLERSRTARVRLATMLDTISTADGD